METERKLFSIILLLICIQCNAFASKSNLELIPGQEILMSNSIKHQFSSTNHQDIFSIQLIGDSLISSIAIFSIVNECGDTIFCERFRSLLLIGYSADYNSPLKMKEAIIKDKVSKFFNEENFLIPAITNTEVYDEDYSNLENWNTIKSDPNSIGFIFRKGEGKYVKISYSKEFRKVVKYFKCC